MVPERTLSGWLPGYSSRTSSQLCQNGTPAPPLLSLPCLGYLALVSFSCSLSKHYRVFLLLCSIQTVGEPHVSQSEPSGSSLHSYNSNPPTHPSLSPLPQHLLCAALGSHINKGRPRAASRERPVNQCGCACVRGWRGGDGMGSCRQVGEWGWWSVYLGTASWGMCQSEWASVWLHV